MIFEGDNGVIDAIKEKKRLMTAGEPHGHIRPLLLLGAGLMKGVYGAGAMVAFEELGFKDVFTEAVGVSSGAPTLAYFLAGQSKLLPDLIAEDIASTQLIRPWHFRNVVDLDYFSSIFSGSTGRELDFDNLLKSPTRFMVAVSEYRTAQPVFFEPVNLPLFLSCMKATVAIPGIVTRKIMIDGTRYVDGASTSPYALDAAYQQSDATHVLAIMNQDKDANHSPRSEKFISKTLWRHRFSTPLLEASNNRHNARNDFAAHILAEPKPAAVAWGDGRVESYELRSSVLHSVADESRQWWHELLG